MAALDRDWLAHCIRRGRPLLGTLVTIQLEAFDVDAGLDMDGHETAALHTAIDAAFAAVAHIGRVMSAHCATSDLGALARAAPGSMIALDPHTVHVLRAAQRWQAASAGAFDPAAAARALSGAGLRPAFANMPAANTGRESRLAELRFLSDRHAQLTAPLRLDLGGIAKGHAVDLAVATLREHGVTSGLVNAGGDMRAFGPRRWPVAAAWRQPIAPASAMNRDHAVGGPRELCDAALATSESNWPHSELIDTARQSASSRHRQAMHRLADGRAVNAATHCRCTVRAPACIDADALTKWGLVAELRPTSPLGRTLRAARATMWRQQQPSNASRSLNGARPSRARASA